MAVFWGQKVENTKFSCPMLFLQALIINALRVFSLYFCIFVFLCLLVSASPIYILLIIKCIY